MSKIMNIYILMQFEKQINQIKLQSTVRILKALNASQVNFILNKDANNVLQVNDFIQQHMIPQSVLFLIKPNSKKQHKIRQIYLKDFGDLIISLIIQAPVLRIKIFVQEMELWKQLCSDEHIGALCEECDIQNIMGQGKYYKDQQNLKCQKCQKQANNFASFVFTLIWAICSILLTLKSIEKSNLMFSQLKSTERFNKILFKLNQDHQSILIKMLLNYLWIFSLIFTFNLQFSISFFFIDQASNTSYFMVNNLGCYLANLQTIELIYSKIFTMLIFILIQFLFVIAGFIMYLMQINQKYNSSIISNTLLSFIHIQLCWLCSIISNRWISNVNYIQGDVSLKYGNQTHLMWMFYFVIPTVVLFGCLAPFSLFIIMYCKKKYLDQIKLRRHLCYLFNEYNETSYFWEQIKLVQKFVMILIPTYFETEISMKASLFGISFLCYQFLTVKYKPYLTSRLNHLDLKTGQICSMSIFLAGVSEQNNDFILSIILQTMIFILCVKLCQPFIWSIAQINYKKNKVPFLILIQNLFQKLRLERCLKYMSEFIIKEKERELILKANYLK